MLQIHEWVKDPLKVQDRPMTFNVTDYEIHYVISYSTLQLTFKTCYLISFCLVIKEYLII